MWRHHRPELVEYIDPGMLFKEGRYPVPQMLNCTEIYGMNDLGYDNSRRADELNIRENTI